MSSMKFLLFLACLAFAHSSMAFDFQAFVEDQQSFPNSNVMRVSPPDMKPIVAKFSGVPFNPPGMKPMLIKLSGVPETRSFQESRGFQENRGFSPENLHVESVAEVWIIDLCDRTSGRCFKLNIRQIPKADYHVDFY